MQDLLDNGEAFGLALLVHVLIAASLFLGMRWSFERHVPQGTVIQAEVVDVSKLVKERQEERAAAEKARQQKAAEERTRQEREKREAAGKAAAEKRAREQAEQQRQQEKAEQARHERERQQQLDALRRQQAEQRERAEEAQKQLQALEEQRRREEAEKQRQAEAQRQRELMQQENSSQQQAARASKEAKWIDAVRSVVTQSWIRPPTARPGLSCTVSVRVIPGGEVISASVVQPCNTSDEATRRSIINAVQSASPLPYRGFEDVFQRSFNFKFTYDG